MRDDEEGGDEERHGVDPVRGVRPRGRGEHAAEHRADRPAEVLDRLQQRVRLGQLVVRHEVRDAGIDGRAGRSRSRGRRPGRARRCPPRSA